MASIEFDGLDELMLDMEQIANMPDSVISGMLDSQADILVEAQKRKARAYGVIAPGSGKMIESIKKGKKIRLKDGGQEIRVYPQGSRTRGRYKVEDTPETEIAFVNEYGKRGQKARPFIQDSNAESEPKMEKAAFTVYDNYLKSKNL